MMSKGTLSIALEPLLLAAVEAKCVTADAVAVAVAV